MDTQNIIFIVSIIVVFILLSAALVFSVRRHEAKKQEIKYLKGKKRNMPLVSKPVNVKGKSKVSGK